MRKLHFILGLALLWVCASAINDSSTDMHTNDKIGDVVTGKLIQKKMHNKAGKELPGRGDFFLSYGGKEVFVKLSECSVTEDELSPHLNEKRDYLIIERDGLWDTDDPNVQSRVGPYVAILEIVDK